MKSKLLILSACLSMMLTGCMDLESQRMRLGSLSVPKNFEKLKTIADKGDPTAQLLVGHAYFQGDIVRRDYDLAKKYYTLAVNNDHNSRWQQEGYKETARHQLREIANLRDPVYQRRLAQKRQAEAEERHRQAQAKAQRDAVLMKKIGTRICTEDLRAGFIEGFTDQKIKIRLYGNQIIYDYPSRWYVCEK
ncbi:sel1 repeat family protein [Neisseria zoodegmatis]|uniref:Lipoprotein n=2 Tax=Neisseria TaxID=482 RepID=A0AB38DRJ2_9NEIS|nr:sel1 repeat family protein [Neisseria zoodegmatis]OSI11621.1 hypothetical protein BWD10_01255 [Neisseria zoodegmatis]SNU79822.1 Uncharacterised protein [Neisseria zoodegmatis]